MPELTASTREAARRLGVSHTALRKAEQTNSIAREPDGSWDIDKTRRRLMETADPARSPLANGAGAEGTPFARRGEAAVPDQRLGAFWRQHHDRDRHRGVRFHHKALAGSVPRRFQAALGREHRLRR